MLGLKGVMSKIGYVGQKARNAHKSVINQTNKHLNTY